MPTPRRPRRLARLPYLGSYELLATHCERCAELVRTLESEGEIPGYQAQLLELAEHNLTPSSYREFRTTLLAWLRKNPSGS